jgi:AraC-like DNA-binding protein
VGLTQHAILPASSILSTAIESVRLTHYRGNEGVAIRVTPAGVPGLLFHVSGGRGALEQITTQSARASSLAPFFLYGPGTQPSVMAFRRGPFTTMQVVFQPHALKTLFGLNASVLANGWAELDEFGADGLADHLIAAESDQERISLLTTFLVSKLKQEKPRDRLVEESLRMIDRNPGAFQVRDLLSALSISERQFERRFTQAVGLSPQTYLRVRRFNEAVRLIQTRRFRHLRDVGAALNFSDQSHFNREIKAFSGMTPSSLAHSVDDFQFAPAGSPSSER